MPQAQAIDILQTLQDLPADKLGEVYDYVAFLRRQYGESSRINRRDASNAALVDSKPSGDRQRVVYQVLRAVSGQLDLDVAARLAVETIVAETNYPHVCIALPDAERAHWVVRGAAGSLAAELGAVYPFEQGVIGRALKTEQMQWVRDILDDPAYVRDIAAGAEAPALRSEIVALLWRGDYLMGALNVENTRVDGFDQEDVLMIQSLAEVIALALENARWYAELQQSAERFRSIFYNASVGIAMMDKEGRVITANDANCRFLGYPRDELMGMDFADLTHPDDLASDQELYRSLLDGRCDNYTIDKRYFRKDGQVVWGRLSVSLAREQLDAPFHTIIVCEDITARKEMEEALRENERQFRLLAENSTDLISRHKPDGKYLYVSPACRALLGYEPEEINGRSMYSLMHPDDLGQVSTRHLELLSGPAVITTEYRIRHKAGNYLWFESKSRAVYEASTGALTEIQIASRDISERKRAEETLRYLSNHDSLTELYNRAFFEEEAARLGKSRQFPVSIVIVDVDAMKTTNDTEGHAAGDDLLRRTAAVLRAAFRPEDIVARIGGDEFAVLLPQTNVAAARHALERCRKELARHNAANTVPLTLSMGVSTAEAGDDLVRALRMADRNMYQEKATHKGTTSNR